MNAAERGYNVVTPEQARALLDACRDSDDPPDSIVGYEALPDDNGKGQWYLIGGDGDGVATVSGSLFCGGAEAIARLFEAASDMAYTIANGDES